jgi:Na+/H+-dicarboxylate symporter
VKSKTTIVILLALALGVLLGLIAHAGVPAGPARTELVGVLDTVTHLFLNLIKMVVAPLVFAVIVAGIAGARGSQGMGPVFLRAVLWFLSASVVCGALGFLAARALGIGAGLHLTDTGTGTGTGETGLDAEPLDYRSFIEGVVPQSFVAAMAENNALQILVFGIFVGLALRSLKRHGSHRIAVIVDELVAVMLTITGYVMRAAPVGVFAAVASAFTEQGVGAFAAYGTFIASFYASLAVLWVLMGAVAAMLLGRAALALFAAIREPMFVAFSTSSTEAAFPKLIESLTRFGIDRRTTGLVLPLGYAFNLDGSMIYMTFASMFLVNAYDVDLSLGQQIALVALLLLSSKGMAGVPRGALVIVAAVVPTFGVPAAGIALLLAIDQILDMARSATNILGNAIATAVIARNAEPTAADEDQAGEDSEVQATVASAPSVGAS